MICLNCGKEVTPRHWYKASGQPRCWRRWWTKARDWKLMELWEQGKSHAQIAEAMGTTPGAVLLHCKRIGLTSNYAHRRGMTARAAAKLLGFGCAKMVVDLIERGHLKGRTAYRQGPNPTWFITDDALRCYLANPDHWQDWEPERITCPDLRRHADSVRGSVRFMTQQEAADRIGVTWTAVQRWIELGHLPAVRRRGTGNRMVRADHVEQIATHYVYGDGVKGLVAAS